MRLPSLLGLVLIGLLLSSLGFGVAAAMEPCACPGAACGDDACPPATAPCKPVSCQRLDQVQALEEASRSGRNAGQPYVAGAIVPSSWLIAPTLRPPQA